MSGDAWLSPDAYAYLDDLSLAGLSWEFLRRNPDYRNDYEQAKGKEASCGAAASETAVGGNDWGLVFPCRPRSHGPRAGGLLAA